MIDIIIKYCENNLKDLNLYEKLYGMAELVKNAKGQQYPLVYKSDGNLIHVTEFSEWYGMGYFRKDGVVSFEPDADANTFSPCQNNIIMTVPLKFVGSVKKSLLKDDAFTCDRVAITTMKALQNKNPKMRGELNASQVYFDVTAYETDPQKVFNAEYDQDNKVKYEYCYVSVDFEVRVHTTKECITNFCGGILVDQDENPLIDQNNNQLAATENA